MFDLLSNRRYHAIVVYYSRSIESFEEHCSLIVRIHHVVHCILLIQHVCHVIVYVNRLYHHRHVQSVSRDHHLDD
jgi:hypothetical protein